MRVNTPLKRKPEIYTRESGHFVGCDGFIVPKSFNEFYDRYPSYVQTWVHRNIHAPMVRNRDDVLDVATDLHMFLMTLPERSVRRTRTITDVIAAYDPARCEGASKAKFFRYVDFTLWNAVTTMWRKQSRDALQQLHPLVLIPDGSEYVENSRDGAASTESFSLQADDSLHANMGDRIRVDQFKAFVAEELDVLKLVEALHTSGSSMRKARLTLGWTQTFQRHTADRMNELAECFESGHPIPQRTNGYKARRKPTPIDSSGQSGDFYSVTSETASTIISG